MLPDGIPINSDNVLVFLRGQLESVDILFSCFKKVFLKISSNVSLDIMNNEYKSVRIYYLNHLNP